MFPIWLLFNYSLLKSSFQFLRWITVKANVDNRKRESHCLSKPGKWFRHESREDCQLITDSYCFQKGPDLLNSEDDSVSLMEKCLHYVIMDKALLSCLLVLELAQLRQKLPQQKGNPCCHRESIADKKKVHRQSCLFRINLDEILKLVFAYLSLWSIFTQIKIGISKIKCLKIGME